MDFTIGDDTYRTEKLNAKQQLKVLKRLAPVIGHLAAFTGNQMAVPDMVTTLTDSLQKISDDDLDYVIDMCLSVTRKEVAGRWIEIWNKQVKQPMFADMPLPTMLQIVQSVLAENLESFWPAQPVNLSVPGQG